MFAIASANTNSGAKRRRAEDAGSYSFDEDPNPLELALLADAATIPGRVLLAVVDCHSCFLLAADLVPLEEANKSPDFRQSLCRAKAESAMTNLLKAVASGNGPWTPDYASRAASLQALPDYIWVTQNQVPAACTSAFYRLTTSLRSKMGSITGPATPGVGGGPAPTREWYQQMASLLSNLAAAWNATPYSMLRVGGGNESFSSPSSTGALASTLSPTGSTFSPASPSPSGVDWSRVKHLITGGFGIGASARVSSSPTRASTSSSSSAMDTNTNNSGSPTATYSSALSPLSAQIGSQQQHDGNSKRSRVGEDQSGGYHAGSSSSSEQSLFAFAVDASERTLPFPPQEANPTETFVHSMLSPPEHRQSLFGKPLSFSLSHGASGGAAAVVSPHGGSVYGAQTNAAVGPAPSAFFSPKPTLSIATTGPADWSALMSNMAARAANGGGGAVSAPPFPPAASSLSLFPQQQQQAAVKSSLDPFRKSVSFPDFASSAPVSPAAATTGPPPPTTCGGAGAAHHTNPFFFASSSGAASAAAATPAAPPALRHASSSSALFGGGFAGGIQQQHHHHAPIFTPHHSTAYHSLLAVPPAASPPPSQPSQQQPQPSIGLNPFHMGPVLPSTDTSSSSGAGSGGSAGMEEL